MASAHDIVVIGGSAGGVESLVRLVSALPPDIPATIFIVVHFPTDSTSYLPQILSRQNTLPAFHPTHEQTIEAGKIYVAPPDFHLLLRHNSIFLAHSPRINGHRPAIDPLFFSAARSYAARTVGVILSGMQDDGVAGLQAIQAAGGVAIVQDPNEAVFADMPENAIQGVQVDFVLPLEKIAQQLALLAQVPAAQSDGKLEKQMDPEKDNERVQQDIAAFEQGRKNNGRSTLTCPGCGGVLWELREGERVSYRCHVGHVYSAESMLSAQGEQLESALWVAVRTLEERATLLRRMANGAGARSRPLIQERYKRQAEAAEANAAIIRDKLLSAKAHEPWLNLPPGERSIASGDQPVMDD